MGSWGAGPSTSCALGAAAAAAAAASGAALQLQQARSYRIPYKVGAWGLGVGAWVPGAGVGVRAGVCMHRGARVCSCVDAFPLHPPVSLCRVPKPRLLQCNAMQCKPLPGFAAA